MRKYIIEMVRNNLSFKVCEKEHSFKNIDKVLCPSG